MKKASNKIKKVLSQGDLEAIGDLMGGLMEKQAAVLATKKDLKNLEDRMATKEDVEDLKSYMNEGFESVMVGVGAIAEKLTEKEKFDRLVEWAKEVGEKVGVKPKV